MYQANCFHAEKLKKLKIEFYKLNIHAEYSLRSGAGGWGPFGGGEPLQLPISHLFFVPPFN